MTPEYINYIKTNIKLKLSEPDKNSGEHQEIACLICSHKFVATPKSKVANYKKYNKAGCPKCYSKRLETSKPERKRLQIEQISNNYIILDDVNSSTYTVMRKECGHIFNAHSINLRYNKISCKVCGKKSKDPLNDILDLKLYGFTFQLSDDGYIYVNNEKKIIVIVHEVKKCLEQLVGNRYIKTTRQKYVNSGFRVLQFWDHEIIENHKLISNKIKYIAHSANLPKIYARCCTIMRIDASTKNHFLEQNHIQGKTSARLSYGAFFEGQLVAVMTFSSPRILMNRSYVGKTGLWELSRFASHEKYNVVGIASKLLNHFKRDQSWNYIYSFADLRWSIGGVYEKLGFIKEAINKPEYYYYIDNKLHHRWGFRRHALAEKYPDMFNPERTEYQNMLDMGYDRIWDAGMIKYGIYNDK